MSLKLQIFAAVFSIGLLALIFEMVRRKLIKESYSLIWFFVAGGFALLALIGNRLGGITEFFGFQQISNAIFVYAIFLVLVLLLGLTAAVTKLSTTLQALTQEVGLLKNRLEENSPKKGESQDG